MKHTHFTAGLSLAALLVAPACGKKSSKDSAAAVIYAKPSVVANSSNSLAVAGQLRLNGLGLTAAKKGVLLFTLDYTTTPVSEPTLVEVAADGSFKVPLERNRLEKIKSILSGPTVNRALAKSLFPQFASEIDGLTDAELREGLGEEIAKLEDHPDLRYVLVSYDISGDRVAEAASMQFIGLPTAGQSLKLLPGEALKGDLNLGAISGTGDEALSDLTAADSVSLSASVIAELASASQTMKSLKNVWMNPGQSVEVSSWFGYVNSDVESTVNKFTAPTNLKYSGGGYYMHPRDIGVTFGEVCPANPNDPADLSNIPYAATPAVSVQWVPPTDIVSPITGQLFNAEHPYSNGGATFARSEQYEETACTQFNDSTTGGLYTRGASESDKEFQLQLGERIAGKTPGGLWRLKVGGIEKGRWDLSSSAPYDSDGDPTIYIPSIKVVTDDAGKATGFEAKFYYFDKATKAFREVTDNAGLKALVYGFGMDMRYNLTHSGGDIHISEESFTFVDGIVRGSIESGSQEMYPCPPDATGIQCIGDLGFSYKIGPVSYRMAISRSGQQ